MQITLTQTEKLNVINLCLTTGLPYFCDYGFNLEFSEHGYKDARKSLLENGTKADDLCKEDVQTEMLRMGFNLVFKSCEDEDMEEGEEGESAILNLELMEKNFDKVPADKLVLMAMEDGNWDADTADVVMQYILF
ncbi:MAG: hypothetical protein PF495_12715, partial [Spirochaetales bacterium]|nr:hypothetical protein [Spirochaetales bacterium]